MYLTRAATRRNTCSTQNISTHTHQRAQHRTLSARRSVIRAPTHTVICPRCGVGAADAGLRRAMGVADASRCRDCC